MSNSLHVADNYIKTILLECINERYISKYTIMFYHTMTVLLEYIDRSLQFVKILAFNNPLCSNYAGIICGSIYILVIGIVVNFEE